MKCVCMHCGDPPLVLSCCIKVLLLHRCVTTCTALAACVAPAAAVGPNAGDGADPDRRPDPRREGVRVRVFPPPRLAAVGPLEHSRAQLGAEHAHHGRLADSRGAREQQNPRDWRRRQHADTAAATAVIRGSSSRRRRTPARKCITQPRPHVSHSPRMHAELRGRAWRMLVRPQLTARSGVRGARSSSRSAGAATTRPGGSTGA